MTPRCSPARVGSIPEGVHADANANVRDEYVARLRNHPVVAVLVADEPGQAVAAWRSLPRALEFATGFSCLAHSIEGDVNYTSRADVEQLLASGGSGRVRRQGRVPGGNTMRIIDIRTEIHRSTPSGEPKCDALQALPGSGGVRVTIETDEGISGSGSAGFGRISGAPDVLASVIEHELKPVVVGEDPTFVRQLHEEMLRETEYHGSAGLVSFGISAVDTAIWDCLGRARGVPCWQLWGGVRARVKTYAMVGWLNFSDEQVRAACREAVEQGFHAVKIKVGYETLREDVERVKTVRAEVGEHIGIMVDANQSLTTAEAIVRGRAFEELGCVWWEEPIPADDIDGYAKLARTLDIPVAAGENLYSVHDFARFLKREALDIVQPDVRRAGGPTALLEIGHLAHAFRIPYASHGGGPVQLNVMGCLANAVYLESGSLGSDSPFEIDDGYVSLPSGPGFAWRPD